MTRPCWLMQCLLMVTFSLSLAGCVDSQMRGQSPEETEREKDLAIRTIGDVTEVSNVEPHAVSGVGLVTGLEGTGHAPQGQYRTMLERELRKMKIGNTKAVLDSPDNALVLVTARIPAGARKGESLDIEVTLPPGSKATSLRGGFLQECPLSNYESTKQLLPNREGGDKLLPGHVLAKARGPLLVGLGNPDEPGESRRARIWGGGSSLIDRPFYLILKNDEKSARIANAVADHINLMFQEDVRKQQLIREAKRLQDLQNVAEGINGRTEQVLGKGEMAKAINKELVNVRVPFAYRYNQQRYLRVARLIPLREVPEQSTKYRRRLAKMLADPSDTIRAALRLEALGKESVPALKRGLESEYALVRFASAEALAYLGSTAGVDELAKLAENQQSDFHALRLYCLMALAGLDEAICRTKLAEMLTNNDMELRCGAFGALRMLDATDPRLNGESVNRAFWLHRVAPKSERLVHFAMGKRAEVVLFGDDIELVPLVRTRAGEEFIVTAEKGDDRCTVSRITSEGPVSRKQCSLRLEDVLRTMVDLGAQYSEIVDLLRNLHSGQGLNCPVAINTLPPETSLEDLVEAGRDPNFLKTPGPSQR